ncbi:MAG: hypothetical protein HY306_05515 [Nitrosomonadales bacterium]|nr:hypothetical protein [Nitrosomonadales bacterium]
MQKLKLFCLAGSSALCLASACAHAEFADCHSCHAPGNAAGLSDFSTLYENKAMHHPVGISMNAVGLKLPNGQGVGFLYFDRNRNGQPDADEIRLFGVGDAATIECASCHREHGMPPANGPVDKVYLRGSNADSVMCSTCHEK